MTHAPLALVYDGDSFFIDVVGISPRSVKIARVIRFANNQNTEGSVERFADLTPECKRAVIAQVNRKFQGMMVHVA